MSTKSLLKMFYLLLLVAGELCAPALLAAQPDDVVVIVHKDNPHVLDARYVADIYTGRVKGWPDGSPVFSLDLGEKSPARELFYRKFVGKSIATMQAVWAQNIFSGKGLPPKLATPGPEMLRIVASNRHAIGYVMASEVDDTVRVLVR
jgi:ABC-type phosphate transport system substrate-binding protein